MKNVFLASACLLALCACGDGEAPRSDQAAPATGERPLASGIDAEQFDPAVRPQDDLYRAVNGHWLDNTPIPPDRSNYGAFTKLADDAERQLHGIIEDLAAQADKADGSIEQKIGDYYAAFMDAERADALGTAPIESQLARIDALTSVDEVPGLMAELIRIGVMVPLIPYIHQDAQDSSRYAGDFWQGGLSLPDRDYYLTDDDTFNAIREDFRAHVGRMFALAELPGADDAAPRVLDVERRIAEIHWDKVANRDPVRTYNAYAPAALATLSDAFDWPAYLEATGYGSLDQVLVSQPSFVTGLGELIKAVPLDDWKTYFRWQVLRSYAPLLSKPLADEHFAFFDKRLNGVQQQRERWKRAVEGVESALGEAVGQVYVEQHFPPENKARMEALVKNLITAYGNAIDELAWMSEQTQAAARDKLGKFTYKIGYPDRWRDYSALDVVAGDSVGNAMRAADFEYQRNVDKLGGPVDRSEWLMTPQTVNAYYNPEMNEIVFPAAILQPPFFDVDADDAVNYGGIGAVIGHEISHGFDDQGSQYDGNGNLKMWWTDEDRARFEALGERLAAQYDAYEPLPGYHVDGHFTLGENIADLGGLTIAHQAYRLSLAGSEAPVIDDLTGDQRFFMGWAQVWRRNYREENLLNRLKSDPHAPSEYRANGIPIHLPAFYEAFGVEDGDGMYLAPAERIKIW